VSERGTAAMKTLSQIEYYKLHHGKRVEGWTKLSHPDMYVQPSEYVAMEPIHRFTDEREYEVFMIGGLICEHNHRKTIKMRDFDGKWLCHISPVNAFNPYADPDAFFITVHVEQKAGKNISNLMDPPRPGTDVTVTLRPGGEQSLEKWKGRVIPAASASTLANTTIYALRPQGGGGFIIGNVPIEATFAFGLYDGTMKIPLKRVHWLMYGEPNHGIPSDTWLKRVILARGHAPEKLLPARPLYKETDYTQNIIANTIDKLDLNEGQRQAVRQSTRPEGGMNIIHGPPGTGKTLVSAAVVVCARRIERTVLALAGSNVAADILAERIVKLFGEFKIPIEGVYRVERQSTEVYMGAESLTTEQAPIITEDYEVAHLSASIRRNLEMYAARGHKDFSLAKKILGELQDLPTATSDLSHQ
jgi:hypothetical protein